MERVGSIFKANFDYESVLYEGRRDPKINNIFEHLFFLCCDKGDSLLTDVSYNDEYLEYLKTATGFKNTLTRKGSSKNWWGSLLNLEVEKDLNSKLTSLEVSKKLGTNASETYKEETLLNIKNRMTELGEVIVRNPFERSGRDNLILSNLEALEKHTNKLEEMLKKGPVLVDEYFRSRDFDLGTTFVEEDNRFKISYQIKNLNDLNGVFRGGLLLKETITSDHLVSIANEYYQRGAREHLQIDSFKFENKWNWLCEVNYRKTMGFVIKKLSRLCPIGNETALIVTPSSWLKRSSSLEDQNKKIDEVDGIFCLSPHQSPIKFWLVTASDREEMSTQLLSWWALVAKSGRDFPAVFNKLISD